jgi:tRNA(adenine34) deaminase
MSNACSDHEKWMREAMAEARIAETESEVPIGAVAVVADKIVGRAHNIRESTHNPLGHAELLLLWNLAQEKKSWRLEDVTIYVTCEPCIMCSGALLQARVPCVVYGCRDPKAGAMGSLYDVTTDDRLNHHIDLVPNILGDECGKMLSDFFKKLRTQKREQQV